MDTLKMKTGRTIFCILLSLCVAFALIPVLQGQAVHAATGTANINVTGWGATDLDNSEASATESQWWYSGTDKTLYLNESGGNYTITGTNPDLCIVENSDANISFTNVNITCGAAFTLLLRDNTTITLNGDNYIKSNQISNSGMIINNSAACTINSAGSGKLTLTGGTDGRGISMGNRTRLNITGNAVVTAVGGTYFGLANSVSAPVYIGNNAKLLITNSHSSSYETVYINLYDAGSTYKWKLTNATLASGSLTDASGSVNISAGATGTIEREALPHNITFDPNGGLVSPASGVSGGDGKLTSLPTPTRADDYAFKGWFTEPNGGTQVTTDTVFTSDTTIFAQWIGTDNSLKTLKVSKGKLSKKFNAKTLSYTLKLKKGKSQTVSIKVTAENGKNKIYKVKVKRAK